MPLERGFCGKVSYLCCGSMEAIVKANRTRKNFIAGEISHEIDRLAQSGVSHPIAGIYRLVMKANSDNFRSSSVQGIIKRLTKRGITCLVYEPALDSHAFFGCEVTRNLEDFKRRSSIIIANRLDEKLTDVLEKTFTRDLWKTDD